MCCVPHRIPFTKARIKERFGFMKYILFIISFGLIQALFLNHIHIFGMATPLLYVYLPLLFHRSYPRWAQMSLCFLTGLTMDMFTNTPGLAAASLTFIGFIKPYLLELYLKKEDEPDFKPSISTMGFVKYLSYAFLLILIYCFIFFSLEAFSFTHWLLWLESIAGSLILTLILILTIDSLRRS